LARTGYLLRSVLHSSGEPSRQRGRYYQTSGSRVDGADRPQRDPGDLGLPSSMPLYSARSRHEVLRIVSVGAGGWRRENHSASGRSPNLNAFAERWVRSAKEECLSKLILFGEGPLSRTLTVVVPDWANCQR